MTGYGRAVGALNKKTLTIEIRSLNGKQLDVNARLPQLYREKEMDIRKLLGKHLKRGKVDIYINEEIVHNKDAFSINKGLFKIYIKDLKELSEELDLNTDNLITATLGLPNLLIPEKEELSESAWEQLFNLVEEAIRICKKFREEEGQKLEDDILMRVQKILDYLIEVKKLAPARIIHVRERIKQSLIDFKMDKVDSDRFEQELIFYLEKLDITEEMVRLESHCNYFLSELHQAGDAKGKKLNFISQEMGREINTIGAKANDANIQNIIVSMKDELEKVKEQMMNIL